MKFILHIFCFGDTQLIQGSSNKTVKSATLNTLVAFIAAIKAKRPSAIADSEYHAINVIEGLRVDYLSEVKDKTFSVQWAEVDQTTLNALVAEVTAAPTI